MAADGPKEQPNDSEDQQAEGDGGGPNLDAAIAFASEFLNRDVMLADIRDLPNDEYEHMRIGEALQSAAVNPDQNDFDALVGVAASMLRTSRGLPYWLADFAADVLEGKRRRPTKRGPNPYTNWPRDYVLSRAVEEVADRFSLPAYAKNELWDGMTAAKIVAGVAGESLDIVEKAYQKHHPIDPPKPGAK